MWKTYNWKSTVWIQLICHQAIFLFLEVKQVLYLNACELFSTREKAIDAFKVYILNLSSFVWKTRFKTSFDHFKAGKSEFIIVTIIILKSNKNNLLYQKCLKTALVYCTHEVNVLHYPNGFSFCNNNETRH